MLSSKLFPNVEMMCMNIVETLFLIKQNSELLPPTKHGHLTKTTPRLLD